MSKKFSNHSFRCLVAFSLCMQSELLFAADAGQQLNQIEQIQKQKEPLRSPPSIEKKEGEVESLKEGLRVTVTQFLFEGNNFFTSAQLTDFLKNYTNKEITFDELKLAVDNIATFYKEQGYLATTSLPKQDISSGIVKIIIVEAKFGGARLDIEPNISYRVHPEIIKRMIESNNPLGENLNLNKLDRATIIANELPGVAITQSLQSSTKQGEAESLIKIRNESAYIANVSADNYGFKSTGDVRYIGNLSLLSPLNVGDKADLTYLHTQGNDYGKFSYNRPLGYSGLRMGVSGSALKYKVIAGAGLSLEPEGRAETLAFEASYPTVRSRSLSVTSNTSFERKHFKNTSTSTSNDSDYLIDLLSIGSSLTHQNNLTLVGQTFASVDIDLGDADYANSTTSFQADKITQGVDGSFMRLRSNINNTQFFNETVSSVIKFNGQLSNSNLDSSQKFYLGGATGVRAYPSSEGAGSEGFLMNLELHKQLPANFSLVGFYDYGFAKQYVHDGNIHATGRNSFNMKGYGASVKWNGELGKIRPTLSLIWSRRIGNNPNPQADGTDSDGSQPGNFYWMNGTVSF